MTREPSPTPHARASERVASAAGPSTGPRGPSAPGTRWILAGVVVVALAVRVAYVLQSRASPLFDAPQMDAAYHLAWARELLAGRDFPAGEPYYRAPLYPWLLSGLLALGQGSLLFVRLAQAVLGALAAALVALLAERVAGRLAAAVAGLLAALAWAPIVYDAELLDPVLSTPLDLLALLVSLRLAREARARALLGVGLAWGLAALARPTVLPLAALVAGWCALRARGSRLRRAGRGGLVLAGLALALAPVTLRNALAGRDLVLVAWTGGVNLWIGNHPGADGSSALLPGARPDLWGGIEDTRVLAEREEARALRPSQASRHWSRKAWSAMAADPARALRLLAWKARLLFANAELSNNVHLRFFAERFGPILRWTPVRWSLVLALGGLGLALTWRRAWELFPLWSFAPLYGALCVLFFVNARFRLPLVAVLCVFAGAACARWLALLRARRVLPALALLLAASLLVLASARVPEGVDTSDAGGHWQLGVLAAERGASEAAEQHFRDALAANPRYWPAERALGATLAARGAREEALVHLERARALAPSDPATLEELLSLRLARGERGAAAALARQVEPLVPGQAFAPLGLALALLLPLDPEAPATEPAPERAREALAAAQRAQALGGSPALCAHLAGQALLALGRPAEALAAFEQAAQVLSTPDAGDWFWRNELGRVLALRALGRGQAARERAEALLGAHPDAPQASALLARAREQ